MQLAQMSRLHRSLKGSMNGAAILLILDVEFSGSFLASGLFCPIWFLVSLLKNAIQRPGWGLAMVRVGIPPLTLGIVLANDAVQLRVGEANARLVIAACEEYHAANGKLPSELKELVPQYLKFIPSAKHCFGPPSVFYYSNSESPFLSWQVIPPFYRKIYNFRTQSWSYLD